MKLKHGNMFLLHDLKVSPQKKNLGSAKKKNVFLSLDPFPPQKKVKKVPQLLANFISAQGTNQQI